MRNGYNASSESFRDALKEVWLAPGRFFSHLDPEGGMVRPTIFASLILYLNFVLEAALQAVWLREFSVSLLYLPVLGLLVAVILTPILLAMLALLVLVVMDGGPSRARFAPVYSALGYSAGIGIIAWIPFGPLVAIPYGAYVATVAVRETLGEDWRKATIGVLVPLLSLIFIILLLVGQAEGFEVLINPAGG
ncbi:MAG: YIP1 family protein [Rubrobacter sp.]